MNDQVAVIGAGVAGMSAARTLAELGIRVVLLEKEDNPGGHVRNWDRLFPIRRPAEEVIRNFTGPHPMLRSVTGSKVTRITENGGGYSLETENGEKISAGSIILATGFRLFDAARKEEYGYGIYDNVITSAELEKILKSGQSLTTKNGRPPGRVAMIHCVGSRDEKVGNRYCSKVCCVTGVKQAMEIREMLPHCELFSFYMDLRMFDRHFEELYYEAQQKWGVNFIRGRLSECSENSDHSILIKTEDTLTGKPLKMNVDMVVLLIGFIPEPENAGFTGSLSLEQGDDGFLLPADCHLGNNLTKSPGVFLAGAVKGPTGITEAMADGKAAAIAARNYLQSAQQQVIEKQS